MGDVVQLKCLFDFDVQWRIEEVENVGISTVPRMHLVLFLKGTVEGAQERRDKKTAAAAALVEVNVEEILLVKLYLNPSAAVRDDAERMKNFPAAVSGFLKTDTRAAMQLADNDALRAVDDEGTAGGNHGNLTHIDFFVLDDAVFLAQAELERKRDGVGHPFADTLHFRVFGAIKTITDIFELAATIITLNRENFAKDRFQSDILALALGHVTLQELHIGAELVLNEVWRGNNFPKFTEVDALGHYDLVGV